jgi:hypothetical protein
VVRGETLMVGGRSQAVETRLSELGCPRLTAGARQNGPAHHTIATTEGSRLAYGGPAGGQPAMLLAGMVLAGMVLAGMVLAGRANGCRPETWPARRAYLGKRLESVWSVQSRHYR